MAKKKETKKNPPMDNQDITVSKEELDELLRSFLGVKSYGGKGTLEL